MFDTKEMPVVTAEDKAGILEKMVAEAKGLMADSDQFWKDLDNMVGYLYQAWGGLVPESEIEAAIAALFNV